MYRYSQFTMIENGEAGKPSWLYRFAAGKGFGAQAQRTCLGAIPF